MCSKCKENILEESEETLEHYNSRIKRQEELIKNDPFLTEFVKDSRPLRYGEQLGCTHGTGPCEPPNIYPTEGPTG